MASRVRELADFLREDPSIVCGTDVDDDGHDADPYTEAAKRILFQVHLSELPAVQRQQASAAGRTGVRRAAATQANAAGA